jgi:hypothetical protein
MRFGNSSDYFGWVTHARSLITLNSATGKAFHAIENVCGALLALAPCAGFSSAVNSAVAACSKVTSPGNKNQRYEGIQLLGNPHL